MSGYLDNLSARQQAALVKFREAVADVKSSSETDSFLLRWLRARDFDVAKAERMYRRNLEWRKENAVDDILKSYEFPQLVKENFPGGAVHPCKDGRPMWIIPGGIDLKAFVTTLTPAVMQYHVIYMLEYIESLTRLSRGPEGEELETHYLVLDIDKFRLRQLYNWQAVKCLTDTLQIMEDHFPECLQKCLVINAPSFFPMLWKMVRPFLTQRTADKVEVFGKEGWKETLLRIVDADCLPVRYGGNMMGPGNDPRCQHKINYGGRFEEGAESAASVFGEDGAVQRNIGPRDRWELPVDVVRAGAWLSWRFQTAAGDLAFGLTMRESPERTLLPLRRIESCCYVPHEGSWHCNEPGTYVLQFDNSYSWLSGKTLAYVVNVHTSEDKP